MSFDGSMDKYTVVHLHNGMVLTITKKELLIHGKPRMTHKGIMLNEGN